MNWRKCFVLLVIIWAGGLSLFAQESLLRQKIGVNERGIVKAIDGTGFDLFKKLSVEKLDSNVIISPFSISTALLMVYNGAAGSTRDEMARTLRIADFDISGINEAGKILFDLLSSLDSTVTFMSANSIWYDSKIRVNQKFVELTNNYFQAEIHPLIAGDAAYGDTINAWVARNTRDKITRIVDPNAAPPIVMMLINATYFNGAWYDPFDPEYTKDRDFTLLNGEKIVCKTMSQRGSYEYSENDELQVIALPYGTEEDAFDMVIILPRTGKKIEKTLKSLNNDKWQDILDEMESEHGTVYLPRFRLEFGTDLNDVLNALGIKVAFTPNADFSGISENDPMKISAVKHKTYVDVDEEGTEAAAVTSIGMAATAARPSYSEFEMRVDHPFIFAIQERGSGVILFLGKVMDPRPAER